MRRLMFKLPAALLAFILLLACSAACSLKGGNPVASDPPATAQPSATPETGLLPSPPPLEEGIGLLSDRRFLKGFNLLGTNGSLDGEKVYKKIRYGTTLGTPQWKIAQWGTRYNLAEGEERATKERYTLADESKRVTVDLLTNAVTLEANASKEYDTSAPSRASWAHLLIEQNMTASASYRLSVFEAYDLSLEFSVDKLEKSPKELHGMPAQLIWYVYVKNVNPDSSGYGRFMWFGLGLLDTRYDTFPGSHSQDFAVANGNFIYCCPASVTIGGEPFQVGKKYSFTTDILPMVAEALAKAKEYNFMLDCEIADCAITGMNLGWELPGIWDVSLTVDSIDMRGTQRP